jgi:2-oxoisovalerate dehydrogenase E2 component (dihydrolipoyl transacylase)
LIIMGIYILKTPDIGEGIAEVELVAWHVKPGDIVTMDQLLADVMTDKATVEVPSPVAGKVIAIGGIIGQTVAVGSELVRIEVEGAGNLKEAALASPAAVAAPRAAPAPSPVVAAPAPAPAAVSALRPAASVEPPSTPMRPAGERPIAAPAVRRRAWELGIELEQVAGTGTAGRIMHADLEAYAAAHPSAPAPAVLAPAQALLPALERVSGYAEVNTQVVIPVIGLRRKIAIKMQDSKRRIPHFTYVEEIDVTEVDALRERLNAQWGERRGRLTLLPLLVRAMVLGSRDFPQLNARFDDDAGIVTRFGAVHVGIATQTDNGLMVPVLRHAEARDLWANAAEISRVSQAAKTGRATREELSGSTITLTSLGALGGIVSTPVINHPEVAIVGVNRIVERPVVLRGAVVVRKMMNLSSSFDHRVVDGLDAAKFVQALRGYLEVPATLFAE